MAKTIDDIFGKPKKRNSNQRNSSRSDVEKFSSSNVLKPLIRSRTLPIEVEKQILPPIVRVQKKSKETPRYLRGKASPRQDCDVIARARSLVLAADEIQKQILNPEGDPIYLRNEHRLATKARARDAKDEAKRSAMRSLASKELRADRVAHERQFENQLARDMATYRSDIKNASVAVQRTLVTDPILVRHNKEKEKARRRARGRNQTYKNADICDDNVNHVMFEEAVSSSEGLLYATGAHSNEGDLAIKRAREMTALALAQL